MGAILFIECIMACLVFTLIMLPSIYENPINHIMSYPKAIRDRVESLPEYKSTIKQTKSKHLTSKLISIPIFAFILALVAYFSGARDFKSAYFHVFILFLFVNIYDAIILDIMIFCNSKKLRIPGTEDMDKEYKSYWHHIRGPL